MPTIRIDNDVWRYLQSKGRPFEDSPNDVLRRELGIDAEIPRARRVRERARNLYVVTDKKPEQTYFGPQSIEVYNSLKRGGNTGMTALEIGERITGRIETRQPEARVAAYYLAQFEKDGLVKKISRGDFHPVEIPGEKLSSTVLRERG
jgi:hypothetical protein